MGLSNNTCLNRSFAIPRISAKFGCLQRRDEQICAYSGSCLYISLVYLLAGATKAPRSPNISIFHIVVDLNCCHLLNSVDWQNFIIVQMKLVPLCQIIESPFSRIFSAANQIGWLIHILRIQLIIIQFLSTHIFNAGSS